MVAASRPRGLMPVWTFAVVIFLIGSAFALLTTGSPRLIPAVAVATLLAGIVATIRVLFSPR